MHAPPLMPPLSVCFGLVPFCFCPLSTTQRNATRFNANATPCLLPGKYPVRTGIYPRVFEQDAAHGLSPKETTLADRLRAHGYATKIVGKWHLGQRPEYLPTHRGFDEWFGFMAGCIDYFSHIFYWGANRPLPAPGPMPAYVQSTCFTL